MEFSQIPTFQHIRSDKRQNRHLPHMRGTRIHAIRRSPLHIGGQGAIRRDMFLLGLGGLIFHPVRTDNLAAILFPHKNCPHTEKRTGFAIVFHLEFGQFPLQVTAFASLRFDITTCPMVFYALSVIIRPALCKYEFFTQFPQTFGLFGEFVDGSFDELCLRHVSYPPAERALLFHPSVRLSEQYHREDPLERIQSNRHCTPRTSSALPQCMFAAT